MEDMDSGSASILVVDDEEKNQELIEGIFDPLGYTIQTASSGVEALDSLSGTRPDLILLDIMMPGMDGFEVCGIVKENPRFAEIPVIFLTARTDQESLVDAFECGAVDYIQKPFNVPELIARVRNHLSLSRARAKLKIENATKDKFFLIISHDLKNPFNSILMNTNLLKNRFSKLDDVMKEQLIDGIHSSVEQTYSLLDNLLEWAKSRAGKLDIIRESFDIHKTASDVITLFAAQMEDKRITVKNHISFGTRAFADLHMITLVFRNLISNALKFSDEGGEVEVRCEDASDDFWRISVTDRGVGIEKEDLQCLFRLDVHHTTYGTRKEKGAGLGLILCQEFISLNGGEITVRSTPGQFTEFSFTLPKEKAGDVRAKS